MATVAPPKPVVAPGPITLRNVEWSTYCQLRDDPDNDHLRMDYLHGKLTIMSPMHRHEGGSVNLLFLVRAVVMAWRIRFLATGTTTLRREGRAPRDGAGKEPDQGFYLGDDVARVRDKQEIDLAVDPPSLAIEVDASRNSKAALATYAHIGVPEVWLYKVHKVKRPTLWFGRLEEDHYVAIGRSLGLPRLTPALVLQALDARTADMDDLDWNFWLDDWARALPEPPANDR